MSIYEAYLHVLDAQAGVKMLSELPMQIDVEIDDYVNKHIEGFFEHLDIATLPLNQVSKLKVSFDTFKEDGLMVADLFYDVMQKCEEIKACDLMCLKFSREDRNYIGFLKLNFRTSYAHAVELEENLIANKIIRQVTTLPYKSQKVEEGFLIDLDQNIILIKDKTVTVDGNKDKYIMTHVLDNQAALTEKRKIDRVTKSAEKMIEKYEDQPMIKKAQMRQMITEQLEESGSIDIDEVVKNCFETAAARDAYVQEIEEKGIETESITLNEAQRKKLKRTQRIKTASGVEIILPYEYVSRSENLAIENHPDGSVSISLRNLGELL